MSETPDRIEELVAKLSDSVTHAALREICYEGTVCPMCLEDITPAQKDDPDAIYHEVVSWVTGPKLQSPVLRGHTGRLAHTSCIKKALEGQAPDQQSIPGLGE